MLKKCTRCKTTLSVDNFYKNKSKPDGFCTECKQCNKEISSTYRKNNVLARKKYLKEWYLKNKTHQILSTAEYRNNHKEYYQKYNKNYRTEHFEVLKKQHQEWRKNNSDRYNFLNEKSRLKTPEKSKARHTLNYAVNKKHIKKTACSVCGNVNSQAHHSDYSKPLDIVWLCAKCHGLKHRTVN
jgi:ribosomal protein S27AE